MGRVIRASLIAAGAAALLASTACTSPVDEHFGEAVAANRQAQIANPAAGNEPADPTPGLDGITVERALTEYRTPISEKTQPRQETTILEIGN